MPISDFRNKLAVVTGAGSGIGRTTALALADRGANLAICDIHDENLQQVAQTLRERGAKVVAEKVDVSSAEQMEAFAGSVGEQMGPADILVNNAGVGLIGSILETSLDDWDWVVGVNLKGVIHGVHFFVPPMVQRARGGHIINIASLAGIMGSSNLGAYSTTKFAVVGLSESLRDELRSHDIGVTAICPGFIKTAIADSSRYLGKLGEAGAQKSITATFDKQARPPEKVAEAIIDAIENDRALVPVNPEAKALYWAKRIAPDATARFAQGVIEKFQK